jgi:uncharacterized membrane protein YedE/YeeE
MINHTLAIRNRRRIGPGVSPVLKELQSGWPGSAGLLALIAVAYLVQQLAGMRHALLWLTAAGLGFVLYRARFGFAGAWRGLLLERRGSGVRAQLALLALLTVVFFPLLARGEAFGQPLADVVRPVGLALLAGAFLFGAGMQIAGACSSGTLTGVGGGSLRFMLVAVSMVAGATLGSAQYGWWEAQPSWVSYSLLRELGTATAVASNLGIVAVLALATVWLERRRHGRLLPRVPDPGLWLSRTWPVSRSVIALAVLCTLTLLLAGRPWVIVGAFPLWGAKLAEAGNAGWDVAFWDYWASDARQVALENSLWLDVTTLMVAGLVVGVLLGASTAGRLWLQWRMTAGQAAGAVVGGLLLGYGGVVGLGCNIGALVAGIASGSLHGWIWFAAAFAGSATVLGLRGRLGPAH